MNLDNKAAFVFTADGKTYKMSATEVSVRNELVANFAANISFSVRNVFKLPDVGSVNISATTHDCICVCRLKQLKLNSFFEIRDNMFLPKFVRNDVGASASLRINLTWNILSNMKLYLAVKMANNGNDFRYMESYLFARHPSIAGDWRLPLPNYYETGKLCLGTAVSMDNRDFCRLRTIQEVFTRVLEVFNTSQWNSDLPANETHTQTLFRFNSTNNIQVPVPSDYNWTPFATRFSNQNVSNCDVEGL